MTLYMVFSKLHIQYWFCTVDINHCVKGSKKSDALNILTMWSVKVGINLTRKEVFCVGGRCFSIAAMGGHVTTLSFGYNVQSSIPRSQFNPNAHPTTWFSRALHHNMATWLAEHKNK
jgi:hypothetical protein